MKAKVLASEEEEAHSEMSEVSGVSEEMSLLAMVKEDIRRGEESLSSKQEDEDQVGVACDGVGCCCGGGAWQEGV